MIGNSIRKFIYLDPKVMGARDKRVAWILVDVNFSGGLPENLDLKWGSLCIRQRIYY